ncbi:MAG TPA: transketolase C-terminal domain-containing protein [Syntrophobacteraceae bacterium]|nr:transketolase C-terminal domain-containing protein [Syntrophobacteraceae bacterium]
MSKHVGMEVSIAAAEAVGLCDVDVVAAYPITPQTHIVEHLSEMVADGHLDAEFVPVESEHSAMSCCIGSSAAGARTFTSTCSQGYALMSELCYIAASLRLPIVMAVANRALSAPISIWNDHADLMYARDTGWIQLIGEFGQEVVDLMPIAFRIAEDKRVLLPVQVNLDGFTLSHVIEPFLMPDKDEVKKFLPPFKPQLRLDPANPVTFGPVGMPDVYTEARKAQDEALKNSKPVIQEIFDEWGKQFGRKYKLIETYKSEDADTIIVTMGSIAQTAMTAIDHLRSQGKKVGLVRFRVFRPFPAKELFDAIKGAKNLVLLDRVSAFAGGEISAPVALEIKSVLYDRKHYPKVGNFLVGLGGRDVTVQNFEEMVERIAAAKDGELGAYEFINVRE